MPFRTAQICLVSSHPEVYEPCDDSFALVDALLADRNNLLEHHPMLCMEVGCGSEAHGVHAELINTDIALGLENRLARLVDVMVVNPPYVPTPEDEVGREGIASSWAGGENGRSIIDRILPIADNLLSDMGWLYMVTLTCNNPSEICLQMRERGYASRIVVQRSTEEESLHVIKFWRDLDVQEDGKQMVSPNKTAPARGIMESLLSQFPLLSSWRSNSNHSS
ncbi:hypothetical protein ACJW30_12G109900 [Castanea mollissima]